MVCQQLGDLFGGPPSTFLNLLQGNDRTTNQPGKIGLCKVAGFTLLLKPEPKCLVTLHKNILYVFWYDSWYGKRPSVSNAYVM
jgi:hypothetical protein